VNAVSLAECTWARIEDRSASLLPFLTQQRERVLGGFGGFSNQLRGGRQKSLLIWGLVDDRWIGGPSLNPVVRRRHALHLGGQRAETIAGVTHGFRMRALKRGAGAALRLVSASA
jgi:hypothetical protein